MWGVSKNSGFPPQIIIHFGGFSPYFWKHPCFFKGLGNWRRHCLQGNCQWRGFRWHCIKCGLCHKATRLPLKGHDFTIFDPQISAESVGWRCRLFFSHKLWRFVIVHQNTDLVLVLVNWIYFVSQGGWEAIFAGRKGLSPKSVIPLVSGDFF